jgi:hypothetical protein
MAIEPSSAITSDERAEREAAVRDAIGSSRIEGIELPKETLDVLEKWATGEISAEEMRKWKRDLIERSRETPASRPMYYLVVDGQMSGTGIRDAVTGGALDPIDLGLSADLQVKIAYWVALYEAAHCADYQDSATVEELDKVGLEIALQVKSELPGSKIQYQSDAKMTRVGTPYL